jgi:tetratricopeptide (TPR) repeat protein
MIQRIIQTRPFQISAFILIIFSIICTRIPLLNYLGFEFSVVVALLVSYLSGLLTLSFWKKETSNTKVDVWQFVGNNFIVSLLLVFFPFLISIANALFIKNCSLMNGMQLYSLIVIPSVIFLNAVALFLGVLLNRWHRIVFTLLYVLILLHIPFVTLTRPQIFAFNPIIGYFPGFSYDETLQMMRRLLTYRLVTIAGSIFIIAMTIWIWKRRQYSHSQRISKKSQSFLIEWILMALLGPIVVVAFILSERIGLSSSEEFIKQKLGGSYQTAHFIIVYPLGTVKPEKIEQLGLLHEFYYDKICKDFAVKPTEQILSFIYLSPEQKGKLIGAANTDITKPWLYQMHINLGDVEKVLKHELVHILAAEFGWSPLKIAPNSGLIEGLAVATERVSFEEPVHRAAALAFSAGVNINLESIFSFAGFAQANAGVSYTMAGSFCRFLIDSMGMERMKLLYATGNFEKVYHRNLRVLLHDWQSFVGTITLTKTDTEKALYFFRRPSIFGKECARVIANLNTETRDLINHRAYEQALISANQSLGLSKTSEAISQKTTILFEMRQFNDVVNFAGNQLCDTIFSNALIPLHLRLGDSFWALDSFDRAREEYEKLAVFRLGSRYEEACEIRLEILKNFQNRRELMTYFIYSIEDTSRIKRLESLTSPVARYLLAREYLDKERFIESAQVLESIGPMESKTLEFFRLRRLGKIYFGLKEFKKAQTSFIKALQFPSTESLKMEITEWIERCDFCAR